MSKFSFPVRGMGDYKGSTHSERGQRTNSKPTESSRPGATLGKGHGSGEKTTPKPFAKGGHVRTTPDAYASGGSVRYHFKSGGFIEKPVKATHSEKGKRTNRGVESDKMHGPERDDTTPDRFARGGKIGPIKKGALHKELGVKQGKKLSTSQLDKAKKSSSGLERKRANFALNARKWNHKAKGGKVADHEPGDRSTRDMDLRGTPMNRGSIKVKPPGQKVSNKSAANDKFTSKPMKPITDQNTSETASEWSDFAMGGMASRNPRANKAIHAKSKHTGMAPHMPGMGGPGGSPLGALAALGGGMGGPPPGPPGMPPGAPPGPMGPPPGGPPMMRRGGRVR